MKITPLEIRQKTFEKNFRGYDRDEVHAFLLTLSQEWERMLDENKELRAKNEAAEREVQKLREVETSLYKTLKTAEETGANVIEQARKAADLHLKESQLKAEALLNEAKAKARDTIEESETRARQIIADMEERMKVLIENYKKLESNREDLLSELKRMASEILDRVERARNNAPVFDADNHLTVVRNETRKVVSLNFELSGQAVTEGPAQETSERPAIAVGSEPKKAPKSFFDEIG